MSIQEELIKAEAEVDRIAAEKTAINDLAWDAAIAQDKQLLAQLEAKINILLDEYDIAYYHYQSLLKQVG